MVIKTILSITILFAVLTGCNQTRDAALNQSPALGISFHKDAGYTPHMARSGDRVVVEGLEPPFLIQFPNPGNNALRLCAFRDYPSVYNDIEGMAIRNLPCMGFASGFAGNEGYIQDLTVDEDGHNYFDVSRQRIVDGVARIKIEKINALEPYPYTTNINLVAVIDRDNDAIIDSGEYERVVLKDPYGHRLDEESVRLLSSRYALNYVTFLDKRSRTAVNRPMRYRRSEVGFKANKMTFYPLSSVRHVEATREFVTSGEKYIGIGYHSGLNMLANTIRWFRSNERTQAIASQADHALRDALAYADKGDMHSIETMYGRKVTYFKSSRDAISVLENELVKARNVEKVSFSGKNKMIVSNMHLKPLEFKFDELQFIDPVEYKSLPQGKDDESNGFAKTFSHTMTISLFYGENAPPSSGPVIIFPRHEKDAAYRVADALIYLATN